MQNNKWLKKILRFHSNSSKSNITGSDVEMGSCATGLQDSTHHTHTHLHMCSQDSP